MKETWQEAAIAERVNDWLAAFSPGNWSLD